MKTVKGCCLLIVVLFSCGCSSSASAPHSSRPSSGEEARIFVDGTKEVLIAVDEKSFDEWNAIAAAKDSGGMLKLLGTGRAFLVANKTKVLVLDPDTVKTKVRVLEGDQSGKSGWISVEFVVKK